MKNEKECKIVQDLFPNYIEELTNEETKKFIENHIKECEECKKQLEDMQNNIGLEDRTKTDKEIKYFKKYNRRLRILQYIILAILLIVLGIISRRFIILTRIETKASAIVNSDNFYIRKEEYGGQVMYITEKYYKDANFIEYSYDHKIDSITKSLQYRDDEESFTICDYEKEPEELEIVMISLPVAKPDGFGAIFPENLPEKLYFSIFSRIYKTKIRGEECFVIKTEEKDFYINAETGLLIKKVDNYSEYSTIEYSYSFGTVTDENVKRPDLTGYTVLDIREDMKKIYGENLSE